MLQVGLGFVGICFVFSNVNYNLKLKKTSVDWMLKFLLLEQSCPGSAAASSLGGLGVLGMGGSWRMRGTNQAWSVCAEEEGWSFPSG